MHITAHPDDEDNPLLVMLGRGRGLRTALLTLTRGEGGQNEIGPELFQALGIIRTEELMSMHRYDGAEQFFTRAYDFGYSFSIEETFQKWDKKEILADVVRVIRSFRPEVIVTLPRMGAGGGQHHQASGLLSLEAFRAAADPSQFPEQIQQGLHPWQAKKIYERFGWGSGDGKQIQDERPLVSVQTGIEDPLLGRSYYQTGMEARSYHRCQGMPQILPTSNSHASHWKLVDSTIPIKFPESDLFDGIDTSLFAIEAYAGEELVNVPFLHGGLTQIQRHIDAAINAFDPNAPEKTASALATGLNALHTLRVQVRSASLKALPKYQILLMLEHKEKDFWKALRLARQLRMVALVDEGTVIPGQRFILRVTITNGSPDSVRLRAIRVNTPLGWRIDRQGEDPPHISAHSIVKQRYAVTVAHDSELTRPYWARNSLADRYHIVKLSHVTKSWSPPAVTVDVLYETDGADAELHQSAQYPYEGPWVGGEQRHELIIVPTLSLQVDPKICILSLEHAPQGREIQVSAIYRGSQPATGKVRLDLPPGWQTLPQEQDFRFTAEGHSITKRFHIIPPRDITAGQFEIAVIGSLKGRTYREGLQIIDYHHIQQRLLYHPSVVTFKTIDVKVAPGLKIGYIRGVGDQVPEALKQLGVNFQFLNDDDLTFGDLKQYDVIITGVRVYLNREALKTNNFRLLNWVKEGGVMVVQYNKSEFNKKVQGPDGSQMGDSPYAPYPVQVSRARVTDENAPIQLLDPTHAVFHWPNEINPRDWDHWVQERGLYFLGKKDRRYRDLISTEDPFEYNQGVKQGVLVEANYGQGKWFYVGLGLWRQLPAGVPGAYRLLANLISLPKTENAAHKQAQ